MSAIAPRTDPKSGRSCLKIAPSSSRHRRMSGLHWPDSRKGGSEDGSGIGDTRPDYRVSRGFIGNDIRYHGAQGGRIAPGTAGRRAICRSDGALISMARFNVSHGRLGRWSAAMATRRPLLPTEPVEETTPESESADFSGSSSLARYAMVESGGFVDR